MLRKFAAAILSALLLSTGWLGMTGLTLLVAFVPLLWLSAERDGSRRAWWGMFGWALLTFVLWNAMTVWWIWNATPVGPIAATLASTSLNMLAFMAFHTVSKRAPKALAYTLLVAGWLTTEYWYTTGEFSWPWLILGNGFSHDIRLVQWYEYTGVFGGSLWVLLVNILLFETLRSPSRRRALTTAAAVLLPMLLSLGLYAGYEEPEARARVTLVQPNVDCYDKFAAGTERHNKKRKTYMWCLVNRKARIVIFFYEDTTDDEGVQKHGGRNRNVLKEFLGDAKIKSLQSDGYNVYMYLDNELMDIDHLCCLAHARAKFKYAFDQGSPQARIFLEQIAKLYGMEDTYRREKLTADEIYRRRNSKETTEVIEKIRTELYDLLANPDENRSELMSKALNYLKNFWNLIFAYRNDGEYAIDNMAAERAIRPITVQRKNSLFFGSVKGIQNSAIYNTFIETCKQAGVSFRDYFCKLLRELKKGRTDYENLLPMTICK